MKKMTSKRDASAFMLMQNIYEYDGEVVVKDNWTNGMEAITEEINSEPDVSKMDKSDGHFDLSQSPEANTRLNELNQQLDMTESNFGNVIQTISLLRTRYQEECKGQALEQAEQDKQQKRHRNASEKKSSPNIQASDSVSQSSTTALEDVISQYRQAANVAIPSSNFAFDSLSYVDSPSDTLLDNATDMEAALHSFDAEMRRRGLFDKDDSLSPSPSYNPVSSIQVLAPNPSLSSAATTEQTIYQILDGMTNSVKEVSNYNLAINNDYAREIGHLIKQDKKDSRRKKLRRHHQQLEEPQPAANASDATPLAPSCSGGKQVTPNTTSEPTIEQIYTPSFQRIVADTNLKRKRITTAKGQRATPYKLLRSNYVGSIDSLSRTGGGGTTKRKQHKTTRAPVGGGTNSERKAKSVGPFTQNEVKLKQSTMTTDRPRKKRIGKFNVSKMSLDQATRDKPLGLTAANELWPSEPLVELYHNTAVQSDTFTSEEALRMDEGVMGKGKLASRKGTMLREERMERPYRGTKTENGSSFGVATNKDKVAGNVVKDELDKSPRVRERMLGATKMDKAREKTFIIKNEEEHKDVSLDRAKLEKVLHNTYGMNKWEKYPDRNVKGTKSEIVKERRGVVIKPVAGKPEAVDQGKVQPLKNNLTVPLKNNLAVPLKNNLAIPSKNNLPLPSQNGIKKEMLPLNKNQQRENHDNKPPRDDKQAKQDGDRPRDEKQAKQHGDRPRDDKQAKQDGDRPRDEKQAKQHGDRPRDVKQAKQHGDRPQQKGDQSEHGAEGMELNAVGMSYAQPTMSSRLKKVDKSYFDRFNFVNVPFVCGTSTSPSHNLGINLQSIFSLMKMKQPGLGLSPTEVAGGLLKESHFTGLDNRPLTRLLSRMTYRVAMPSFTQCPAMQPISEIDFPDCDDTASTTMRRSTMASVDMHRDCKSSASRFGRGSQRPEDAWTSEKDSTDQAGLNAAQCVCMPTRKTTSVKKVVKQYFEDLSGSRRKLSLDEQEQGDMFESLQTRIKGLKKVLLALQEDFQTLNKEYNETCAKNNRERSSASKERIGELEKQLGAKEEEINVVMGLFKEVMSLKGQIKQLGAQHSSPMGRPGLLQAAAPPSFCRTELHNPYEITAAVRHTRLLRCMQNFQGQLRH